MGNFFRDNQLYASPRSHNSPLFASPGKRRRERARSKRRREERSKDAEGNPSAAARPTPDVVAKRATLPSTSPPAESRSPVTPLHVEESNESTGASDPQTLTQAVHVTRAYVLRARPPPLKRVKAALTVSRASQRAAVLAKKRGAMTRHSTSPKDVINSEDETAPEILRGTDGENSLDTTLCFSPPPSPPPPSSPSPPSSPQAASSQSSPTLPLRAPPPTPPPMSSQFPRYFRKVLCKECFVWDHDYSYYHCMNCHTYGPPKEKERIANLKRYAIVP